MTAFTWQWLEAIWVILVESRPYLLAGFLIAGALKVLIPEQWVYKHLGQDNTRSVFLASLFGVPIPLCSCSVIPTAISLKRSGASKGATTSFLISTPETGVDSIGVTYALMDPIMTVVRPLTALFTAFVSGTLVNRIVKRGWDDQPEEGLQQRLIESDHDHDHDHGEEGDECHGGGPAGSSARQKAKEAWHYAFGTLMADLTPWFILGFIVSGLITLVVPDDFFGTVLPNGWMSMMAMLVIGVPLYICATASTPVAAALLAKGLDPGSALILLLAGPATNIATIAVVRGFLGRRVLYAYLGSIALCSLALGFSVNALYSMLNTSPTTAVGPLSAEHSSAFAQLTGAILLALLAWHAHRLGLARNWGGKVRQLFLPLGIDLGSKPLKVMMTIGLIALYVSTAVSPVKSGQTGFVIQFGKVLRIIEEPGAVWHAPAPFARVAAVSNEELRAGHIQGPGESLSLAAITRLAQEDARAGQEARMRRADLEASTELLTRDEYLLRCEVSVHYRVTDAEAWLFRAESPQALVQALAEMALREAGLARNADELLIGDRDLVQDESRARMQAELDRLAAGIAVVQVNLDEVHASADPGVHYAFRDVASALEDQARYIKQAEEYRLRREAAARAQAVVLEEEAIADANATLQRARGEAASFSAVREVLSAVPGAHRARMRLESLVRILKARRIVGVLDPARIPTPLPSSSGVTNAPLFDEE
ncbi:MAG: SO_0444 family Cu/Zn efflux transporter [Planctomycetes bacterium]|nr:SO_0444 family Cu/Zn efflux transporter [Planctomycetota bacterium]